MRSVLLGNGINIQFGGFAYNSDFIMKRIKYSARLDRYEKLFENKITGDEIEKLLNSFVTIANGTSSSIVYSLAYNLKFDASRSVPTADENRPLNYSVNYCIIYE